MTWKLVATCPEETKTILAQEGESLGATVDKLGFRAVYFEVPDLESFYKFHLQITTASHLFWIIKSFAAKDDRMLFSQVQRIKWRELFDPTKTFRIDAYVSNHPEWTPPELSKRTRQAMQEHFQHHGLPIPHADVEDPDVLICIWLENGRATVSIRTSGDTLHKRGYRLPGHMAPLKETVAATVLRAVGYDGSTPLYDPMCGSGTIVIEAAMMALGKACLIHRKKDGFAFERLKNFDRALWQQVQHDLREGKKSELTCPIYASDISSDSVTLTRETALRARVERYLTCSVDNFFDTVAPCPEGLMISNLPYGDRMQAADGLDAFYEKIGDHLKKAYKGWTVALLVSAESPWKSIGLKPKRKVPLVNGSIPVLLLIYEIY